MEVKWTDFAAKKWQNTANKIYDEFGFIALQKFVEQTESWQQVLSQNPQIGGLELLLIHRKKEYRSIILSKLTKLVYFIENDCVIIANIWDTRREPLAQTRETK